MNKVLLWSDELPSTRRNYSNYIKVLKTEELIVWYEKEKIKEFILAVGILLACTWPSIMC